MPSLPEPSKVLKNHSSCVVWKSPNRHLLQDPTHVAIFTCVRHTTHSSSVSVLVLTVTALPHVSMPAGGLCTCPEALYRLLPSHISEDTADGTAGCVIASHDA